MKAVYVHSISPFNADTAPDSTLITRGNPWFVPDDGARELWTVSLWAAAVIDRLGLCVKAQFATRYYSHIAIVAHPHNPTACADAEWLRDGATIVGSAQTDCDYIGDIILSDADGTLIGRCSIPDQHLFAQAISAVSAYATIKTGDLILLPLDISFSPALKGNYYVTDNAGNRLMLFKSR